MWDEKKFFEDFSKETDQINPDEEFIKSLKTMTSEHVPAKRGPVWVRYGVVAAAVVLCTVGGILVRNLNIGKTQPDVQIENGVLHGKTEDQTPVSGTIILTLDAVIGCVKEENTAIIDETGGSIDEEERKQLIHMLEKAVSADYQPEEEELYHEYHCSGSSEFTLKVYEGGYFLVEETGLFYKIQ